MLRYKAISRGAIIILVAISVMLCPLVAGISTHSSRVYAQDPFNTLPPYAATLTALAGTAIAGPTVVPTLGPWQYFEEDNRPEVSLIEAGDDQFGYGPLKDNPNLYAMWITDNTGTHYFVVPKGDASILGDEDPLTHQRLSNGFDQFIPSRDEALKEIEMAQTDIDEHTEKRDQKDAGTAVIVGFGIGFCIGATLGLCGGLLAVATPIGIGLFVSGRDDNAGRNADIERRSYWEDQLAGREARLIGKFNEAVEFGSSQQ